MVNIIEYGTTVLLPRTAYAYCDRGIYRFYPNKEEGQANPKRGTLFITSSALESALAPGYSLGPLIE
jgi:hypothetical protein